MKGDGTLKATIFNVQRGCTHDGPGIRTTVFFKGCPLCCAWCCNPESQQRLPELSFSSVRCIGCGRCITACSRDAISPSAGPQTIDRTRCVGCMQKPCAVSCPARALEVLGYTVGVAELVALLCRDQAFYRRSGGGVTASGGEALLYPDFLASLFDRCQALGLHTTVETCLQAPLESIQQMWRSTDLFLCDLKHTDGDKYARFTGGNIDIAIKNLEWLAEMKAAVELRVPLVPGFNADEETLSSICALAQGLGFTEMSLMKYHRLGLAKYEQLARECSMAETPLQDDETLLRLTAIPERYGIRAMVGGG